MYQEEAMIDRDCKPWLEGMDPEIKQLRKMDCWDVVPQSKATRQVVPRAIYMGM